MEHKTDREISDALKRYLREYEGFGKVLPSFGARFAALEVCEELISRSRTSEYGSSVRDTGMNFLTRFIEREQQKDGDYGLAQKAKGIVMMKITPLVYNNQESSDREVNRRVADALVKFMAQHSDAGEIGKDGYHFGSQFLAHYTLLFKDAKGSVPCLGRALVNLRCFTLFFDDRRQDLFNGIIPMCQLLRKNMARFITASPTSSEQKWSEMDLTSPHILDEGAAEESASIVLYLSYARDMADNVPKVLAKLQGGEAWMILCAEALKYQIGRFKEVHRITMR